MNEKSRLGKQVAKLEAENNDLREKLSVFETIHGISSAKNWMRDGMRAEHMIAGAVDGETTPVNGRFDVVASGIRFEVKYSNLCGIPHKTTKRWTWNQIKGHDGLKTFDRLILVGAVDERFKHLYKDPNSPFVLFDVPYAELPAVMIPGRPLIQLSSRIITSWSKSRTRALYRFQVTLKELADRYRRT